MFNQIPQKRLLLYIMLLGALPLLLVVLYFFSSQTALDDLRNSIQQTENNAFLQARKQAHNKAVQNHYRDADRFYIDKHLEKITLLEPEIQSLKDVINNKNFAGDDNVKKRLDFLTGPSNKLLFSEGVVDTSPTFQETIASLVHPVEVNAEDVATILALIEGNQIGPHQAALNRPQLVIIDFNLDKKSTANKNEVFQLNMKILKREIL
jgi:hypothetical protein